MGQNPNLTPQLVQARLEEELAIVKGSTRENLERLRQELVLRMTSAEAKIANVDRDMSARVTQSEQKLRALPGTYHSTVHVSVLH